MYFFIFYITKYKPSILNKVPRVKGQIVTTQPLGSILEAKPLHQGQKTRILGRGSQSCSHLYSTLPVPSHYPPLTPRLRPRSLALGDLGYPAGVSAAHPRRTI